jgi:hypothetical protein
MSQSFSGILQMENGNFYLFAENGKQKRQTSICLLQMETEKGSSLPWWANDKR